jgi:putative FmdB family regulatory protein
MPIYAYRCEACGFAKDVLQKLSDAQLTECPSCGKSTYKKQVTAAGFQLKGTGWYVTDFRGGNSTAAPSKDAVAPAVESGGASATPSDASTGAVTPAASGTPAAVPTTGGAKSTSD